MAFFSGKGLLEHKRFLYYICIYSFHFDIFGEPCIYNSWVERYLSGSLSARLLPPLGKGCPNLLSLLPPDGIYDQDHRAS